MDPTQHVARPRTQLPQHQPEETHQFVQYLCLMTSCTISLTAILFCFMQSCDPPGRVGGSYEEVDGHSVTHVETLLHLPTQREGDQSLIIMTTFT